MRIISGSNKGKKLIMPKDKTTRPLKDMAKESIFNILTHAKYINFSKLKSICVVLCSRGYPEKFENNVKIKNLEQINLLQNQNIFHAGTLKTKNGIVSNGGRVLNFVSTSDNFSNCRDEVINLIKRLNWENGYFRRDIGHKVIK